MNDEPMKRNTDLSDQIMRLKERATTDLTLDLPDTVLTSLEEVASIKGMSLRALVRLYIGEGLREDLAHMSANRVANATAEVLLEKLESEEEVTAILEEIHSRSRVPAI